MLTGCSGSQSGPAVPQAGPAAKAVPRADGKSGRFASCGCVWGRGLDAMRAAGVNAVKVYNVTLDSFKPYEPIVGAFNKRRSCACRSDPRSTAKNS
jgi:hypothetical protein